MKKLLVLLCTIASIASIHADEGDKKSTKGKAQSAQKYHKNHVKPPKGGTASVKPAVVHARPAGAIKSTFKLKCSFNGTDQGYMGLRKGTEWCALVSDAADALNFKLYPDSDGQIYYQVVGGPMDGKYLSYSANDYVGLYVWYNATAWKFSGSRFVNNSTGNPLSMYKDGSDGYLYEWKSYSVLDVTKE